MELDSNSRGVNRCAVVLLGRDALCIFKKNEMVKAVVTFIACFYLMDLDYPAEWLVSLSVLQKLIFGDEKFHPDGETEIAKELAEFQKYCESFWNRNVYEIKRHY